MYAINPMAGDELTMDTVGTVHGLDHFELLKGAHHVAGTIGIDVRIPPAAPVVAVFDTGAAETDIAVNALATAVEGTKRATGTGVGGSEIEATVLVDQYLEVGATRVTVPMLGVRHDIPAPEDAVEGEVPLALIGMDLLSGTALAIEPRDRGSVWWLVPSVES